MDNMTPQQLLQDYIADVGLERNNDMDSKQGRLEYVIIQEESIQELQKLARDWQAFAEEIEDCLNPNGFRAFNALKERTRKLANDIRYS